MTLSHALAIDIGDTHIKFGLIDEHARLIGEQTRYRVPFRSDGVADVEQMIALMKPHMEQAAQQVGTEVPIGISLCGNVDHETGYAPLVPNLHWRHVPLGQLVSDAFGLPVYAATDVRQAALAEAIWGAAQGANNFLWITVGTGYGGYLFLNGRLYPGSNRFAGNAGHTPVDEINGYPCGCGHHGCFETYVAGPAIARRGQAVVDSGRPSMLIQLADGSHVTPPMVFEAANAGDTEAQAIFDDVIRLIAQNLAGINNVLDLDMILMGGGIVNGADWFVPRISDRIRGFLMTEEARERLQVMRESFPNASLWGAAAHVFVAQGIIARDIL